MKFLAIASALLLSTLVLAEGISPAHRGLIKRKCVISKCACSNGNGGIFCGNQITNIACTNGHVFQCNPDGGATCDFGVRDSCTLCGKLTGCSEQDIKDAQGRIADAQKKQASPVVAGGVEKAKAPVGAGDDKKAKAPVVAAGADKKAKVVPGAGVVKEAKVPVDDKTPAA